METTIEPGRGAQQIYAQKKYPFEDRTAAEKSRKEQVAERVSTCICAGLKILMEVASTRGIYAYWLSLRKYFLSLHPLPQ